VIRKSAALVVLLALLLTGCGAGPSGVIRGQPAPSGPTVGITLYFLQGGATLIPVRRNTNTQLSPSETLAVLFAGPTAGERDSSYITQIPPSAAPGSVAGTVVTVSVDVRKMSALALDQIVCTVQVALATTDLISVVGQGQSSGPRSCPVLGQPPSAIPGVTPTG
jgi:hypothetical protein